MRKLALIGLLFGCGAPPQPGVVAPATPIAPNSASPKSVAVAVPGSVAPPTVAAPITDAPPPPPTHECTVFVMGDPKTAFKATVKDKQFKQEESTSTEISMYTKVLQGDDMRRIELCDAFVKRRCPEAWRGDGIHCRMQMTTDAEADWGSATPVPK